MTAPRRQPPDITHARVLKIALPIVLSNATVPLLGAVDTGVIGQLGQAAPIGAVGVGAVVLASFYWIFGFLRMGTTGMAAQAQGAGDVVERAAVLYRALIIGLGAGVMLILGQVVLFGAAFAVAPASPEVERLAQAYLAIRIWGAPATIALYAVTGWLIALERTRAVFVLLVWMNGLNMGLDLWFVLGLGWGVPGVAAATLIAEWTGLALGLWFCRTAFGPVRLAAQARLGDMVAWHRMAGVNANIMVRSVVLQGSFTAFIFLGAGQGDVTLAANQVLLQFIEVAAYALDGFAFTAEALVGQAVGAKSVPALRRAAFLASAWAVAGTVLIAVVFWQAGPAIIDLLTTEPAVRRTAGVYLPWLIAAPLVGVASWMLDGIFVGATGTREMRNARLISVAVYAAALAALLPAFGNHGLWAALMVLNTTRAVTLGLCWPAILRAAGGTTVDDRG